MIIEQKNTLVIPCQSGTYIAGPSWSLNACGSMHREEKVHNNFFFGG